jgi:hypothetical protein
MRVQGYRASEKSPQRKKVYRNRAGYSTGARFPVPPARSICDSSQPPKISPCGLASAGIAMARKAGSVWGGWPDVSAAGMKESVTARQIFKSADWRRCSGSEKNVATGRISYLTRIVAIHITHPATLLRGASRGDPVRRSEVVVSPEAVSGRTGEVRETCSSG